MVWADASQGNRPKKSSTIGYVGGFAPRTILNGEEESVALVTWRSTKAPRESLGSNGSAGAGHHGGRGRSVLAESFMV